MQFVLKIIKKGNDSITFYLQRIKDARDCLFTVGACFDDNDIVISTLNGLPAEYNTIRYIIKGHETVISLNYLQSRFLLKRL